MSKNAMYFVLAALVLFVGALIYMSWQEGNLTATDTTTTQPRVAEETEPRQPAPQTTPPAQQN